MGRFWAPGRKARGLFFSIFFFPLGCNFILFRARINRVRFFHFVAFFRERGSLFTPFPSFRILFVNFLNFFFYFPHFLRGVSGVPHFST